MNPAARILISQNPSGSLWQLGPLPPAAGRLMLIGWSGLSSPFDDQDRPSAGVTAFLGGLTRVARLTFPCSAVEKNARADWTAVAEGEAAVIPSPVAARVLRRLTRRLSSIALLSTRDATAALRMFDDEHYPWPLQGQFALLSPRDQGPPPLPPFDVAAQLFEPAWTAALTTLPAGKVDAIVRPGVDGDLVGILSRTSTFEAALIEAIKASAQEGGLGCEIVPEDQLADALAVDS